ncbi:MAG TPA: histidine kinase [Cyclobacteriaceae bacterium]
MPFNFYKESDTRLRLNRFARLGTWYILALSIVATVIITGQVLIQRHLKNQQSDSHIINVAGKQRMLSQKITKLVLLIHDNQSNSERESILNELNESLRLWKFSQEGLLYGSDSLQLAGQNTPEVVRLIAKTNTPFARMYVKATSILSLLEADPDTAYILLQPLVADVLSAESSFLNGMENVVLQYDKEARDKIAWLSNLEYSLLIISLLVIAIEIIFIFRPTAIHVNNAINKLVVSEKNSKRLTKEIRMVYASLEKSYEQISQINKPIDNPRIYAKSDKGGNVIFISPSFTELSGRSTFSSSMRLSDLFTGLDRPDDWMDEWIDTLSENKQWQGDIHFKDVNNKICWVAITIIPVYNEKNEIEEWAMMGSEITRRKTAEQSMDLKNQAKIEKQINQQKFRSVLILEGQEEERKRIAMDIHDGIGQMLTSLKYHLESIDLNAQESATRKLGEIDQLIKQVIKEVRKVTFNLKPPVLGDYGLNAALSVFVKEIAKLVDARLEYRTEGEIERLPQKVENNVFRITQEAINNSIKYSGAEVIEVILKQVGDEVIVIVKDEGKGFDTKIVEERSVNIESGRGLFNMYERTEYINGTLEIDSRPGKGTTVKLNVPVKAAITIE